MQHYTLNLGTLYKMECNNHSIVEEDPVSYEEITKENVFTVVEDDRSYRYTKDTIINLYKTQAVMKNPMTNVPFSKFMIEKVKNFIEGRTIPITFRICDTEIIRWYDPFSSVHHIIKDYFDTEDGDILTHDLSLYRYDFEEIIGDIMNEDENIVEVHVGRVSEEILQRYAKFFGLPDHFVPLESEEILIRSISDSYKYTRSELIRFLKIILPNVILSAETAMYIKDIIDDDSIDQMIIDTVSDPWNLDNTLTGNISIDIRYKTNFGIHPRTGEKIPFLSSYRSDNSSEEDLCSIEDHKLERNNVNIIDNTLYRDSFDIGYRHNENDSIFGTIFSNENRIEIIPATPIGASNPTVETLIRNIIPFVPRDSFGTRLYTTGLSSIYNDTD